MLGDRPNRTVSNLAADARLRGLSDEELMAEIQQGDGDAFTVLFDRYSRLVLTVALRIIHDASEAQEVTQEIFFEFYRTAGRFDPARGKLKVWLLQFAYRRSINRRNQLLLRQFYNQTDIEDAMTWEASTKTTARIPAQELQHVVREGLNALSEAQRTIIEKVIFEGLTLREVSERVGSTYSVARNNYYRGLDRLRAHMNARPASKSEMILGLGEVSRSEA